MQNLHFLFLYVERQAYSYSYGLKACLTGKNKTAQHCILIHLNINTTIGMFANILQNKNQ